MLFNSFAYAFFLPLVFGLYWGLKRKGYRVQNGLIIAASYFFYGYWDWRFLSLMFFSTITDYVLGIYIDKANTPQKRKRLLIVSLVVNLGVLGFFKYFDFFTASMVGLLSALGFQASTPALEIILPVGITFYTLQSLSYTIDVYRRRLPATRDPVAFFAFISFFPQLVAGPIERAPHLLKAFQQPRTFQYAQAVQGCRLILWGLFKKIVVADRLAEYVDVLFARDNPYTGTDYLLAALFFAFQLYCDFSAYSDIARGSAKLFGIELMHNFKTPFLSTSLQEFWNRWHISLSSWFRDYVYFPLGGRRVSAARWAFNIMAVFLLSGLWHGAAWHFVCWGLVLGIGYLLEAFLFPPHPARKGYARLLGNFWAVGLFTLSMYFFRGEDLGQSWTMLFHSFSGSAPTLFATFASEWSQTTLSAIEPYLLFGLLGVVMGLDAAIGKHDFSHLCDRLPRIARWGFYYLLLAAIGLLGAYGKPVQFIYFQF